MNSIVAEISCCSASRPVEVLELRDESATCCALRRLREGDWAGEHIVLQTVSEFSAAFVRRVHAGTAHLREQLFVGVVGVALVGVEVLKQKPHTRIELVASLGPLLRRGGRVMLIVDRRRKKRRPRWLHNLVWQLEVLAARAGEGGHSWKS